LLGIPEVPAEEQSGLSQDPQVCQQHSTEHAHEEHSQLNHYFDNSLTLSRDTDTLFIKRQSLLIR
jgi:hypothetical protein